MHERALLGGKAPSFRPCFVSMHLVIACGSRGPISFDAPRWYSLEGERLGEEACKREVAGLCGAFVPGQCGLEALQGCCLVRVLLHVPRVRCATPYGELRAWATEETTAGAAPHQVRWRNGGRRSTDAVVFLFVEKTKTIWLRWLHFLISAPNSNFDLAKRKEAFSRSAWFC